MNDFIAEFFHSNEPLLKITIYIIAIILIWSIVRAFIRMIMPVIVIGLVMVVFLGFSPDEVIHKGKQLISDSKHFIIENVIPYINDETLLNEDRGNTVEPRKWEEQKSGESIHSL